jgi:glycosyltransferase involved in cell wall biosynthesis
MAAPLRVIARPAYANRHRNPYNALLADGLRAQGVEVVEYSPDVLGDVDTRTVVHVHWPESNLNHRRWVRAAPRSARVVLELARARRRGARVVWTVHNIGAHDSRWHRTEALFWRRFLPLVDGWVSLSPDAVEQVIRRWPALASRPHAVTEHGHYRGAYPAEVTRAAARARLGLAGPGPVVAFIGRIKPYKGVPGLLRAFGGLAAPDARLVVAGRVETAALAAELRALAAEDERVVLIEGVVPDEELQVLFGAADLVVAPFVDILNSGSVLLALSFDRPVLVPARGSMSRLAELVGSPWVQTYEGEPATADLEDALTAVSVIGSSEGPDLAAFQWGPIAERTVALYRRVLGHDAESPNE